MRRWCKYPVLFAGVLLSSVGANSDSGHGTVVSEGSFDPASCSSLLFGEAEPRWLEANWAQSAIGSGLLRDSLLTPEEKRVPIKVTMTGESGTTADFRERYRSTATWRNSVSSQRDFHTEATISLLTGPWDLSVISSADSTFLEKRPSDPYSKVSTNQSAGCSEDAGANPKTLFLGSAGNDWTQTTGEGLDFHANCLWVTSSDALGYASDFTSWPGRKDRVISAPSDSLLKVMDGEAFGGTSGAAPMAGAASAFLLKAYPELSSKDAATILRLTATSARRDDPHGIRLGSGTVNIPRALAVARHLKSHPELKASDLNRSSAWALIPRTSLAFASYQALRQSSSSCQDYKAKIQRLMLAAHLEPEGQMRAKRQLADFYLAHGLGLSAHRILKTPASDPALVEIWRGIQNDRRASDSLKSAALQGLTRAGKISHAELRGFLGYWDNPFVAMTAAKQLAFSGVLTKQDCKKINRLGRRHIDSRDHMIAAAWGSDIAEPVMTQCRAFGPIWRDDE
jgi:hypothetical protein